MQIEDSYPPSPMQQGMIFHSLYAPHSGVDIEQMIGECHEEIDVRAFQRAWQRVVDRHAALRTSFHLDTSGEPFQKVQRHVELNVEEQDWRHLSEVEREAKLKGYVTADRERGFELSRAPLMRLTLLR